MGARVFVSQRGSDEGGVAAALSQDLQALFGDGQIDRIDADSLSGERWRDAVARTAGGGAPILLAVVAPDDFGQPVRDEIEAALDVGAHVLPLLTDGIAEMLPGEDLPAPFERLSRLPRRPLRAAQWESDVARIAEDLRELGVRPLAGTQPGTMPLPIDEPTTTPMPLDEGGPDPAAAGDGGRRGALGMVAVALLGVGGGWGVWRWQQRRTANLSGTWRAQIGRNGAPTSRDGRLMIVKVTQTNRHLSLSSTVGVEDDPLWEVVRDAWKERTGNELKQVDYRGEGELLDENEADSRSTTAASQAASEGGSAPRQPEARRQGSGPGTGVRRVVIAVRITAPGSADEMIDEGTLRGVVGDRYIQGRLWLEREQAERVIDLQRDK